MKRSSEGGAFSILARSNSLFVFAALALVPIRRLSWPRAVGEDAPASGETAQGGSSPCDPETDADSEDPLSHSDPDADELSMDISPEEADSLCTRLRVLDRHSESAATEFDKSESTGTRGEGTVLLRCILLLEKIHAEESGREWWPPPGANDASDGGTVPLEGTGRDRWGPKAHAANSG